MMPPHTVRFTLEGTWTPADVAAGGPYRYLPFAAPAYTARIDVAYTTASLAAGEGPLSIDIGLFDPRGLHFLQPNGYRGWTGAFRSAFFVAPHQSTPAYRRGDLSCARKPAGIGATCTPIPTTATGPTRWPRWRRPIATTGSTLGR